MANKFATEEKLIGGPIFTAKEILANKFTAEKSTPRLSTFIVKEGWNDTIIDGQTLEYRDPGPSRRPSAVKEEKVKTPKQQQFGVEVLCPTEALTILRDSQNVGSNCALFSIAKSHTLDQHDLS